MLVRLLFVWLSCLLLYAGAHAQLSVTGVGGAFGPGAGGGGTTNWNPSDLANITLSGSNLVATGNNVATDGSVRSVANHSTGKYYFEGTLTVVGTAGDSSCGIANGSTNLTTAPNSALLVAVSYAGSGNVWVDGSNVATLGAASAGDIFGVAFDAGAQLFWIRRQTGLWNNNASGNPSTAVGGFTTASFAGPYFAWCSTTASSTFTTWTANFGATAYTNHDATVSGFGNW